MLSRLKKKPFKRTLAYSEVVDKAKTVNMSVKKLFRQVKNDSAITSDLFNVK